MRHQAAPLVPAAPRTPSFPWHGPSSSSTKKAIPWHFAEGTPEQGFLSQAERGQLLHTGGFLVNCMAKFRSANLVWESHSDSECHGHVRNGASAASPKPSVLPAAAVISTILVLLPAGERGLRDHPSVCIYLITRTGQVGRREIFHLPRSYNSLHLSGKNWVFPLHQLAWWDRWDKTFVVWWIFQSLDRLLHLPKWDSCSYL